MNKEVRWNKNMKKTRVQKSRDTVPLIVQNVRVFFLSVFWVSISAYKCL